MPMPAIRVPKKPAPKRGRTWYIAAKRGSVKAMPEGELKDAVKHTEHMKAAVRAKVEHPFRVVKRQFGYQKVRFKGLLKNTAQIRRCSRCRTCGWRDERCWLPQGMCACEAEHRGDSRQIGTAKAAGRPK